jgi:dihydroflavonol-4-reductase
VFIDTRISVTDIADTVEGHLLAAEHGVAGRRYVLCGAVLTTAEAMELPLARVGSRRPPADRAGRRRVGAAAVVEGVFRLARRHPPFCRAMARTIIHGHAYDGRGRATSSACATRRSRTPSRRTLEWARAEGLVRA